RPLLPVLVEERRAERLREPRAELEDVADLERDLESQRAAAVGAAVALAHLADVGEARLVVPPRLDAAQVPAVAVRAGHELPLAQGLVGDDLDGDADRPERAAAGAERAPDLVLLGGPKHALQRRLELHVVEPVVAAHEAA